MILEYYGDDKKARGFVLSQDDKGKLSGFAVTVDDVEKLTGINFFPLLSDSEAKELESTFDASLWDLSEFNRSTTAKKYGYDLSGSGYSGGSAAVSEAKPEGVWQNIQFFLYTNLGPSKRKIIDFFDDLFDVVEKKDEKL